jgi:hypothetical protein
VLFMRPPRKAGLDEKTAPVPLESSTLLQDAA